MKKRLFLYTTLIIFAGLLSFFLVSVFITAQDNLKMAKDTVIETTLICANLYGDINSADGLEAFVRAGNDTRITVISKGGDVLADSRPIDVDIAENHLDRPEIQAALNGSPEPFVRHSSTMGADFIYYALKVDTDGGNNDYVFIRTAVPVAKIDSYLYQSLPMLFALMLFVAVLCFFLTRGIVARILKPFGFVENRLKLLITGNYDSNSDISSVSSYEEINKITNRIDEIALLLQKNLKQREEFFANASHELKTPLTAIKGFNELTSINNKDEKLDKYIAGITRETARMLSLIGDMLNLSQLENAKECDLNPVAITLSNVIKDIVKTLSPAITEKNLSFELTGNSSMTVLSEPEHIYELTKNLIENAVRYNKPGGNITVRTDNARLSVSDSGIGIPEDDLERIFERFYRVEKSRSQRGGGTGLGLSIVKHICELYGWKLSLKSNFSMGTEITVEFESDNDGYPIRRASPAPLAFGERTDAERRGY